jgi:hypothetical protein
MIIKLTCSISKEFQESLIRLFSKKVTCLSSSCAFNTTPLSVIKNYGVTLSFWYVDEIALKKFYGGRVGVRALTTYPGVLSATVMDLDVHPADLRDLTQYQLESLLWPRIEDLP